MAKKEFIKKRNDEIIAEYNNGVPIRQICALHCVTKSLIMSLFRRKGIKFSTKNEYVTRGALSEWHRKFGIQVLFELEKEDCSVADMAEIIGTSTRHLLAVTRGETDMTVYEYVKICDTLRIDPEKIIERTKEWDV